MRVLNKEVVKFGLPKDSFLPVQHKVWPEEPALPLGGPHSLDGVNNVEKWKDSFFKKKKSISFFPLAV